MPNLPRTEKRIRQLTGPRVTEQEEIALLRLAARLDRSASYVMRMAINELLERHGFSMELQDEEGHESRVPLCDSSEGMTR